MVTTHRAMFQITVNAVPVRPMWHSMPEPIGDAAGSNATGGPLT
jgi:hypothetical protein